MLASQIGCSLYDRIASGEPTVTDLAGEWLFCFDLDPDADRAYVDEVLFDRSTARRASTKSDAKALTEYSADLLRVKAGLRSFVQEEARAIVKEKPSIVGFTTVFQQTMASLALADAVKSLDPDVSIIFGGANCEAPMGKALLEQYGFLDAVVSGEGERDFCSFAGLLDDLCAEAQESGSFSLEDSPIPDFSDYFQQLRPWHSFKPQLTYEASRGCWWGQRIHCTFCGLNGASMKFRSKSAKKVLRELREIVTRYPGEGIEFVDNILDMKYFKDVLPALAEMPLGRTIFVETKANLKQPQLELLRRAGVSTFQPGIESLSDNVLRLMGKGVAAIQNVYLLRAAREAGLRPLWNWLWGFPGEDPADYEACLPHIPLLEHLQPPGGAGVIRLDRYSPLFEKPAQFGVREIQPYPAYRHLFPAVAGDVLSSLAYYFTFKRTPETSLDYTLPISELIERWKTGFRTADLVAFEHEDCVWIWDTRSCATELLRVLKGPDRAVYQRCVVPASVEEIHSCGEWSEQNQMEAALERLVSAGVLIRMGARHLALPLDLRAYQPDEHKLRFLASRIASNPAAAFPASILQELEQNR